MAKHTRSERGAQRSQAAAQTKPEVKTEELKQETIVQAEQAGVQISESDADKVAEGAAEKVAESGGETKPAEAVTEELVPVLGKYAKAVAARGNKPESMPSGFKYSGVKLVIGSQKPQKETSVMGRIYAMVAKKPGMTGAELVTAMQDRRDWNETGAKIKYAANGLVCADWCVGYINGAMRPKNGFLEAMKEGATKAEAKEVTKEHLAVAEKAGEEVKDEGGEEGEEKAA